MPLKALESVSEWVFVSPDSQNDSIGRRWAVECGGWVVRSKVERPWTGGWEHGELVCL